jgi:VCBS repeat-containing protein
VQVDGALTASGALSISDIDPADNPTFPDVPATSGDAGYGTFAMVGGTWQFALFGDHAAVQALAPGDSLVDTHTFVASDGSTQPVTVTINSPSAAPRIDETVDRPPPTREPTVADDPPPDDDRASEAGDPEAPEDTPAVAGDEPLDDVTGTSGEPGPIELPPPGTPIEIGEVVLSVLADPPTQQRATLQQSEVPADKPNVATAQSFLQELKSFWVETPEPASLALTEVRFGESFWDGLDKMADDLDQAAQRDAAQMQLSAEAAAGVGISLTAGFVSWALRAGSMAASFLAAMPTWRHFDPMPVLAADDKRRDDDAADGPGESPEDETVDELFEK